jgi:hypothetical protein
MHTNNAHTYFPHYQRWRYFPALPSCKRSTRLQAAPPDKNQKKRYRAEFDKKNYDTGLPPLMWWWCFRRTIVSRQNGMPMLSHGLIADKGKGFVALATPGEFACVCVSLLVGDVASSVFLVRTLELHKQGVKLGPVVLGDCELAVFA